MKYVITICMDLPNHLGNYREEQISQAKPFSNPNTTSIKAPAGQGCPRCGGNLTFNQINVHHLQHF